MRRLLLLAALLPAAAAAPAQAAVRAPGGAEAPDGSRGSGGSVAGRPLPRALAAVGFAAAPGRVRTGARLTFRVRLSGGSGRARVRVDLVPAASRRAPTQLRFGLRRTGRRLRLAWTPRRGELPAGTYRARLVLAGTAARPAVTVVVEPPPAPAAPARTPAPPAPAPTTPTAPTSPSTPATPAPARTGTFPVRGPFTFGGDGARFGAGRTGHVHQGQDVVAAEGTPLVSPVAGYVFWSAYQKDAAGYYVVIRGDDGTDYVLMHLQAGSVAVAKGQAVAAGQRVGAVGATGDASGPHLHFEVWPDGWWSSAASKPVDPLPILQAWAAAG
jgi:murein DD-endopeptidase MepM/ murein hydrolase activator NlpD